LLGSQEYFVPAGLFQDDTKFEFTEQIYIDRKPHYYEFKNQTVNLSEAEVLAKYAAGGEPSS
jgi:hypothetical protein